VILSYLPTNKFILLYPKTLFSPSSNGQSQMLWIRLHEQMKPGDGVQYFVDHVWLAAFFFQELFKIDKAFAVSIRLFAGVISNPEVVAPQEMSPFREGHILDESKALSPAEWTRAVILDVVMDQDIMGQAFGREVVGIQIH